MKTLREFIAENTLSPEQIETLRKTCKDIAKGRLKNNGGELPSAIERTLSDGMNKYSHHQEILKFISRRCKGRLDKPMTEEDLNQLISIPVNIFELKYFLQ